jgi:ATP-dependent helicase HepA
MSQDASMVGPPPRVGEALFHALNAELGAGRVERVDGRHVLVYFPKTQTRLTLAAADRALRPVRHAPGTRARLGDVAQGERVTISAVLPASDEREAPRYRLTDGREVAARELWPEAPPADPVARLSALAADGAFALRNRLEGLRVQRVRQARGLGSFLGGRIALFPHQLHVAERATAADPVRWLLADEVGLGKTIEACLILSRLLRTGRAERTLVVTPATLSVQWLGELWRKFHQVFVLLDERRRADVAREFGVGFNPFEAHRRAVIALEDLSSDPRLVNAVQAAGLDLLVVDEAHRLERRRGDAGSPAYRALRPLTQAARHVLLLSATPLEADTHGFFRLLELLRPEAYASEDDFLAALAAGRPLPPCTSATRRVDMGGIPPRQPEAVDIAADAPGTDALPAARSAWLAQESKRWAPGGDDEGKALVFCHTRATLDALKTRLETATGRRVAIFHEELSPERCDLEVADFRRPEGPTLLLSTECGGEGRNFEFCRRLVLFDLPRDPAQVEQRIGRLDRVTRQRPIEIVYFRPQDGFEAELVRLYEDIGLFRQPLGGLERSLAHVERAIRKAELGYRSGHVLPRAALVAEVHAAVQAREAAVYHHLHTDGYTRAHAVGLLERVPPTLDADMQRFVRGACQLLGFDTYDKPGRGTCYIEFGGEALIDHLPGVPGGSRFLGTFVREEAVLRDELDFFASGHALVEGLFQELEDGQRGRAALVALPDTGQKGAGVLVLARVEPDAAGDPARRAAAAALPLVAGEEGGPYLLIVLDLAGRARPDWARLLLARLDDLRRLRVEEWQELLDAQLEPGDWPVRLAALVERGLARAAVFGPATLEAVAAFRLLP